MQQVKFKSINNDEQSDPITSVEPVVHDQEKISNFPKTITFIHNYVGTTNNDIYVLDAALALYKNAYNVFILTSNYDEISVGEAFPLLEDYINVRYSCWWIPNSISGMFTYFLSCSKSVCMAIRMILWPPGTRPDVVIVDTDAIALPILWLGLYKTVYIHHFSNLKQCATSSIDLLTSLSIPFADKILVQTNRLKALFQDSHPKLARKINVLYPCYDTEVWTKNSVNLKLILPDILVHKPCIFLTIGKFKEHTNFKLLLNAMDQLYELLDNPFKKTFFFIIAGNYKNNKEDKPHYFYLIQNAAKSAHASQIHFLTYVTQGHMKSLIEACTILVHLKTKNLNASTSILTAMSMWKPIIATKTGFAGDILTHNESALLIEPTPLDIAKAMMQLANDEELQHKLCFNAYSEFTARFSYGKFQNYLNEVITDVTRA